MQIWTAAINWGKEFEHVFLDQSKKFANNFTPINEFRVAEHAPNDLMTLDQKCFINYVNSLDEIRLPETTED